MEFEESKEYGPHSALRELAGSYVGTAKTWFQPGVLGDESPIEGTLRLVLGGRFLLHEYTSAIGGDAVEGMAFYGYQLQRSRWEAAWIDNAHNGSAIMFSSGHARIFSVKGSYLAPEGPDWSWRTEITKSAEGVVIRHYNVEPDGAEGLAVEIDYRPVG